MYASVYRYTWTGSQVLCAPPPNNGMVSRPGCCPGCDWLWPWVLQGLKIQQWIKAQGFQGPECKAHTGEGNQWKTMTMEYEGHERTWTRFAYICISPVLPQCEISCNFMYIYMYLYRNIYIFIYCQELVNYSELLHVQLFQSVVMFRRLCRRMGYNLNSPNTPFIPLLHPCTLRKVKHSKTSFV